MSQQRAKSPSWGQRPSKKAAGAPRADLDKFVNGRPGQTRRLNVEIPAALHTRVKSGCALEEREIRDVVTELLEKRFPNK